VGPCARLSPEKSESGRQAGTILNKAVGMNCPVQILRQQSIDLDRKINEAIARDPGLRQMVENVEDKNTQWNRHQVAIKSFV